MRGSANGSRYCADEAGRNGPADTSWGGEGYDGERRLAADMGSGELAVRQLYAQKDKTQAQAWVLRDVLVPLTGIELVTFALRMRCSTD